MKTQFTVDKEFIKEAYNSACPDWKAKLKNKFPEAFESELKTGKWYKSNLREEKLYCFTKFEQCDGYVKRYYYGFSECNFMEDYTASSQLDDSWTLATDKEVETALIAEAKKIYTLGCKIKKLDNFYYGSSNLIIDDLTKIQYEKASNQLSIKDKKGFWICVFKDGKWAEIIFESIELTLEQRIEIIEEQLKIKK